MIWSRTCSTSRATFWRNPCAAESMTAQATARGYLGLGILAEAAGKDSDAIEYYQRARDELVALHSDGPDEPHLARALADCHMRLARLAHDSDPDAAAKNLQSRRGDLPAIGQREEGGCEVSDRLARSGNDTPHFAQPRRIGRHI